MLICFFFFLFFFDPIAVAVKCLTHVDMTDDCRQKLARRCRQVGTGVTEPERLAAYRWKENRWWVSGWKWAAVSRPSFGGELALKAGFHKLALNSPDSAPSQKTFQFILWQKKTFPSYEKNNSFWLFADLNFALPSARLPNKFLSIFQQKIVLVFAPSNDQLALLLVAFVWQRTLCFSSVRQWLCLNRSTKCA